MEISYINTRTIFWFIIFLMILFSCLLLGAKEFEKGETLAERNANDSLMTFVELATEDGGRFGGTYTEAQKSHAEMIQTYVDQMNDRDVPLLFNLLSSSRQNIVTCLEEVAQELKQESSTEEEARKKIEQAAKSIAEFFSESGFLINEPTIPPEPEVMPQEVRDTVTNALKEAHERAETFFKNPSVATSEDACMTNRRAIVYLYLARFGYDSFITEKELKQFRTDINRTIYHNRLLQQDDIIKAQYNDAVETDKDVDRTDYSMLEKHSDSEIRRLRLLQAIIDKDFQRAQTLLQTAIIEAMPEIQF